VEEKICSYDLIVLGGSFGAVEALLKIIPNLSPDFSIPIAIVVHRARSSHSLLSKVLQWHTKLIVREPEDNEKILPKHIYVARPNYHLLIEQDKTFSNSYSEPVNYSRPSIDVLFDSAADVYREKLTGILLTGANADGASGMKHIKEKGGLTIVEDPTIAVSPVMPMAAIKISKLDFVQSITEIIKKLNSLNS